MMCQRIGMPPISTIGLGRTAVSSPSRVPRPPARITVRICAPRLAFDTMTQPPARDRKATDRKEIALLLSVLAGAAFLRLRSIGFGVPALNDPDEPLFMMTALDMLRGHTLNPHWFGHPGTTTLYCLAAIIAGVAGLGTATGRFADADAFAQAVYADPGIVFLP